MLVEGAGWAYETVHQRVEGVTFISLREAAEQGEEADWPALVAPEIKRELGRHNLPRPAPGTLAAARLETAFLEHLHKLSEWALRRHHGEFVAPGQGVAPVALLAAEKPREKAVKQIRLMELFESYSRDKTLNDGDTRSTRKTISSYRAIAERFIELQGDLGIRAISREVIGSYRAALAQMPAKGDGIRGLTAPQLIAKADAENLPRLSEPTIRNQLRAVSAILSHAVRLQWLDENPVIAGGAGRLAAKAATRRVATVRRRKDYTVTELQAIFSSPIFTQPDWAPPRADFGKAWYWLPLMLFYTGARREELAQLLVSDVRKSEDGIWHLNILAADGEEDGPRGVKTESSRRSMPLHADLLTRGLLDYVDALPAGGRLFPALLPNPDGYFGANFGKR